MIVNKLTPSVYRLCFIAGTTLHVKTDAKRTTQKGPAEHSPKKSKASECDGGSSGSSLENISEVKVEERKRRTDAMSCLSVSTSKVRVKCFTVTMSHCASYLLIRPHLI